MDQVTIHTAVLEAHNRYMILHYKTLRSAAACLPPGPLQEALNSLAANLAQAQRLLFTDVQDIPEASPVPTHPRFSLN